ncbi:hypothetical protein LDENG_00061740 [Lucifuga dentata]|nr:hypothetical protein LDENG_00061740 [Lucifuga dentata]
MAERRRDRSFVRYYCTAGNGMEVFLVAEVKRKVQAEDVCQLPGKVLFSSSAGIDAVRRLKAAERLFLLLRHDSPVTLPAHTSTAKAASVLQSRVLGDRNQWINAVMTWSRLQRELAGTSIHNIPRTDLGLTGNWSREQESGRQKQREEEEKWNADPQKSTAQQKNEESGADGQEEEEEEEERPRENGAETLEKKRKRGSEEREAERLRDEERRREEETSRETLTCERKRKKNDEEEDFLSRGPVCSRENATLGREQDVERSCSQTDDKDSFSGENMDDVNTAAGRAKTPPPPPPPPVPVSFRISCKCTGALARRFSTQELSQMIGAGLSRLLGWKADLKNPQLEVNVSLSDDRYLMGIPLTRFPLAKRSYMSATGLRSTVAWALASLAHIQPGFCVLDPMCGAGTILIEAAQEHKDACFLGVDIDDGQLQKANENVAFAELGNRINLLKASSIALPLPSACVDAVISDLPFGRKFGTKTNMAANLPVILTEMERILRVGGVLVLLLSPQLSFLLKKLQQGAGPTSTQQRAPQNELRHTLPPPLSSLKHQATHRVSLGAIDGLIHKYVKTGV